MKLPMICLQADLPEGTKEYIACTGEERLSRGERLPVETLMGAVLRPRTENSAPLTPDNFVGNLGFVQFLHEVIAREGPNTTQLIVDAESVGNGTIYVIDDRTPKPKPGQKWEISSEDVLGQFEVKDGRIVDGSYQRNPDHRLFSERGFLQLEDELGECLVAELERLPEPDDDYVAGSWQFPN